MKRNSPLFYCACGLIVLIALIAAFGGMLKPHGISESDKIVMITKEIDGKLEYSMPPFEPNSSFPLGSDHRGFDILSMLMNGLKYTLGVAALLTLLRFLIAVPLGMWSGVTGRGSGFLKSMQWVISAVPAFLFLYPPLAGMYFGLGLNLRGKADPHNMMIFTIVFFAMVTFLGLFPLAYQIAERARFYSRKPYVEASRLMGGSVFHTIKSHILASMRLELLFTVISEFILVLFLMGQLAIFNIIVGGSETLEWEDGLGYYIHLTTTGEWTSLIAYGAKFIRIYPFILLHVSLCFTGLILSLQFFLVQFKKRYGGTERANYQ
ncbi:hypothetical protein D7Z26_26700 [Cohnella endophytica]|uniref:ABC transporter permease subunit n=1 Tax=Cohnella endophytica TaxID=2419778 RepID=A0A494X2C2_9BACL|nr:hypothetical protein [Cohnella endophytica]RKP44502.1 hypothetical protein D7Z26_26700 [Cohnella endophytica]